MNEREVNKTGEDGAASLPSREGRFDKYAGALPVFKSIKEINRWIREIRADRFEWEDRQDEYRSPRLP